MVGVQREDPVHRAAEDRVDHVVLGRHREAHVEEVRGVVEAVARIDERLADRVLVGPGDDRRHLGDHPDRRHLALPGVGDVGRVVVEGRHRAHGAADDRHRVRVAPEAAEEVGHLLVQHGVVGDPADEVLELRRGRQLAVEQQVGDLEEVRLLGELLDRIAAVEQLALLAVDVGDRALAGAGRGVAGVEGEDAAVGVEPADVDDVGPDGAAGRSAARASCRRWRAWRCGGPDWSCVVPFVRRRLAAATVARASDRASRTLRNRSAAAQSSSRARLSSRPRISIMSKTPERDRPAGQRHAERLGDLAEAEPLRRGEIAHDRFEIARGPV